MAGASSRSVEQEPKMFPSAPGNHRSILSGATCSITCQDPVLRSLILSLTVLQ